MCLFLAALALAALVVAGCGSDSTTVTETNTETVTTPTTDTTTNDTTNTVTDETTTDETTTATTPTPSLSYSTFRSPSGNIGCQMNARNVRCDIRHHSYADPPTPGNCPLDYGDSVGVNLSGPGYFVCHGDTAIISSAPSVAYGSSTGIGPFVCDSEESGMKCTNTDTGNGFTLSIQSAQVF